MRILLGSNRYFNDVAGGGNRVAWDAAQHLAAMGHEVVLVCEGIDGKPESEPVGEIRVLRYRVPKLDLDFLSRHQRAARKVLFRQLVAEGWVPDLLWGHMPLQAAAMIDVFPAVRMTYTMHSPVLMEFEEAEASGVWSKMKGRLALKIERRACKHAGVITVLSEFTLGQIRRLHGDAIAAKAKITPGWADLSRFHLAASRSAVKSELDWPQDRTVFFTVRRLVLRMGLDRLLDAAALLRDRNLSFHLYIAGSGPMRAQLESKIATLKLDDRVRLLGTVSETQLAAMYSAADAFVIPTRALECFGLVAVEAMSAGTPALSTPVGALPEIFKRIEPQWLARDNSAESIAELMGAFVQGKLPVHSPEELRRFVEDNYDRTKMLDALVRTSAGL